MSVDAHAPFPSAGFVVTRPRRVFTRQKHGNISRISPEQEEGLHDTPAIDGSYVFLLRSSTARPCGITGNGRMAWKAPTRRLRDSHATLPANAETAKVSSHSRQAETALACYHMERSCEHSAPTALCAGHSLTIGDEDRVPGSAPLLRRGHGNVSPTRADGINVVLSASRVSSTCYAFDHSLRAIPSEGWCSVCLCARTRFVQTDIPHY